MRTLLLPTAVALAGLLHAAPVAAAVLTDEVLSKHIKDADNTSGQDTNSGAGVKTGHLQNGAVTAAKLGIPQVVVVAMSGAAFNNPAAAVASITDASASKPYVVKIMPGVYNLGTASLQMKPYVDVIGSGPDSTVITSTNVTVTNVGSGGASCTGGTVRMANESTLAQVTVMNTATSYAENANALVFHAPSGIPTGAVVNARAEFVAAISKGPSGSNSSGSFGRYAVCVEGVTNDLIPERSGQAWATLVHVYAEGTVTTDGISGYGVRLVGYGHLDVTDSRIVGKSTGATNAKAIGANTPGGSSIIVNNSTLESESSSYAVGIRSYAATLHLFNSRIILRAPEAEGFSAQSPAKIYNSVFESTGPLNNPGSEMATIANTQLPGGSSTVPGAILVGCYDQGFSPIANTLPPAQ